MVDVETLKKLDWLLSNPKASNKDFGAFFGCHPNNATNLRARYPKIFSGEIKLEDLQEAIIFEQEQKNISDKEYPTKVTYDKIDINTRILSGFAAWLGIPNYWKLKREQLIPRIKEALDFV